MKKLRGSPETWESHPPGLTLDFSHKHRDVTGLQQSELEHREYARQLSSLHLIASEVTHTGKDQVAAALALCREELDMDSGYIGVVDEATSEFVQCILRAKSMQPIHG